MLFPIVSLLVFGRRFVMLFAVVVGLPEETNGTMETQEKLLTETETRSPLSTVYVCTFVVVDSQQNLDVSQ